MKRTITALGVIAIFLVVLGGATFALVMSVGALSVGDGVETGAAAGAEVVASNDATHAETMATIAAIRKGIERITGSQLPPAAGCIRHDDGTATISGLAASITDSAKTATVAMFEDGMVCLGQCVVCAREIDGTWVKVEGWRDD